MSRESGLGVTGGDEGLLSEAFVCQCRMRAHSTLRLTMKMVNHGETGPENLAYASLKRSPRPNPPVAVVSWGSLHLLECESRLGAPPGSNGVKECFKRAKVRIY